MEQLWAPWRMQYVAVEKPQGCIFCEKPHLGDDRAAQIVYRGNLVFVMLNAFPYNNGHIMVAPYAHVASLEELSKETAHEMIEVCQLSIKVLKQAFSPDGLNIGANLGAAAGAGVKDHVHMHVVPRWVGDTNFMPVLADTRVIPQALEATWEKLTEIFARLATKP